MNNDPELSGKYLGTITKDFVKVSNTLKEASYQLRKRQISDYPIFPVCKIDQPIGQLLMSKMQAKGDWNVYFSMLEEFQQRKLIDDDKEEGFKQTFKDPEEFCCLFVVDAHFTNFVYIPYPDDDEENDELI